METIAEYVLPGSVVADIGTDHAYLPVYLLLEKKISKAIAGDIAEGPCHAAANTVAMYGQRSAVEIRLGSGLSVLHPGEADCIVLAGMGGSTMVEILEADLPVAQSAQRLVLQPQTGAMGLRKWLCDNNWSLVAEKLVCENKRLYEIVVAEPGTERQVYTEAEFAIGPLLLEQRDPLLKEQFAKVLGGYQKQLAFMEKSTTAVQSEKYKQLRQLTAALEVLADACDCK